VGKQRVCRAKLIGSFFAAKEKRIPSYYPLELRCDYYLPESLPDNVLIVASRHTLEESFYYSLAQLNPPYIDIPYEMGARFSKELKKAFPHIKQIISFHNDKETPNDLEALLEEMQSFSYSSLKCATFAQSSLDALRMLSLLKKYGKKIPLMLFCTGEKGSFSRILQPLYGGVFSYASIEQQTAKGQFSIDEMEKDYFFSCLNEETQPYALIGKNLEKSPSNRTHTKLFRKFQHNGVYVKIELEKEEVDEAFCYFRHLGFKGLSVTHPLKQVFCTKRPYNTVRIDQNSFSFLNTDGPAAVDAIEEKIPIENKKVLVLGSGGMARGFSECVKKRGAALSFSSSQKERVEKMAEEYDGAVFDEKERYDIAINCSLKDQKVPEDVRELLFETRFDPASSFLHGSGDLWRLGALDLWVRQAAKQFAFWIGTKYPVIDLPPSKSQTLRAILFASLAKGRSVIDNYLHSPDTLSMIEACRALSASIKIEKERLIIDGVGEKRELQKKNINAGNSGIVLRFVTSVAALFSEKVQIDGDASMHARRSMKELLSGLTQLGAKVSSKDGHAPIAVKGPIALQKVCISGKDSQPVSALLIALSLLPQRSELYVEDPGEKPWVALTLDWLEKQDVRISHTDYSHFAIEGKNCFSPFTYKVKGDLSTLGFAMALPILTSSSVRIQNVDLSEPQGDKRILAIYKEMGARFQVVEDSLFIAGPQVLQGGDFDLNDAIDLVTLVAVLGLFAQGETRIRGVANARDKESNRLKAMREELSKMGGQIEEIEDGLLVRQSVLCEAQVASYHDHRVAMALFIAGKAAGVAVKIENTSCIQKSYPNFFEDSMKIV